MKQNQNKSALQTISVSKLVVGSIIVFDYIQKIDARSIEREDNKKIYQDY